MSKWGLSLITAQTNYFPLPHHLGQTAQLGRGGRVGEVRKEEKNRDLIERRRLGERDGDMKWPGEREEKEDK